MKNLFLRTASEGGLSVYVTYFRRVAFLNDAVKATYPYRLKTPIHKLYYFNDYTYFNVVVITKLVPQQNMEKWAATATHFIKQQVTPI